MFQDKTWVTIGLSIVMLTSICRGVMLDERIAEQGEWGYRPAEGAVSAVNPPSFVWRPQSGLTWQVECKSEQGSIYTVENLEFNVHCPPQMFRPGKYRWRYRGQDSKGEYTQWSKTRTFTIANEAVTMPLPVRDELLSRIPKTHPRLFLRPENIGKLVKLSKGKMKDQYNGLIEECEKILKDPPSTEEPPKYPEGTVVQSEVWYSMWWPNRKYTIKVLDSAATLGFTYILSGNEKYGLLAKRLLMECAEWDPKGSTGFVYNDEAGMPYNYYFARTYTFVNDLLTEAEKQKCRAVMKVRGEEMYNHLCPEHLWNPYNSHSNRAWHFLGEVAIAFHGEIEGADDWLWFAMNVFYNVYPVWSDDDGGWHEGINYWLGYQKRFTWWIDVMREAMGINAFDKPYYGKVGYYAMYLYPPGMAANGFGDLVFRRKAQDYRTLMSVFAAQAQNSYWQWYVDQLGGPVYGKRYIGFIRGAQLTIEAQSPDELPASRLFKGTGRAYLNTQITDAKESVQVVFKSDPFGTMSHGYEANNSFLLWGYGKRLLIRTGRRDDYGGEHHSNWMWSTRSVNNITVNGKGQRKRPATAVGEITSFKTTPEIDIVVGEAGGAYEEPLERYSRAIIFVKPELVIVYDRLVASQDSTFEYWLHAINEIAVDGQHHITVTNDDVLCNVDFLAPASLTFTQTDQYDPNPLPKVTLREWHLTAKTPNEQKQIEFVTLYRVHRKGQRIGTVAELEKVEGGYVLKASTADGSVTALLPFDDSATMLQAEEFQTKGKIAVRFERDGMDATTVIEN